MVVVVGIIMGLDKAVSGTIINVVFGIVVVIVVVVVVVVVVFGIVIVVIIINCEGTYTTLSGQPLSGVRVLDTAIGTVIVML